MPRNHVGVDVCCKCHAVHGSERKARGETLAEAVGTEADTHEDEEDEAEEVLDPETKAKN